MHGPETSSAPSCLARQCCWRPWIARLDVPSTFRSCTPAAAAGFWTSIRRVVEMFVRCCPKLLPFRTLKTSTIAFLVALKCVRLDRLILSSICSWLRPLISTCRRTTSCTAWSLQSTAQRTASRAGACYAAHARLRHVFVRGIVGLMLSIPFLFPLSLLFPPCARKLQRRSSCPPQKRRRLPRTMVIPLL